MAEIKGRMDEATVKARLEETRLARPEVVERIRAMHAARRERERQAKVARIQAMRAPFNPIRIGG